MGEFVLQCKTALSGQKDEGRAIWMQFIDHLTAKEPYIVWDTREGGIHSLKILETSL